MLDGEFNDISSQLDSSFNLKFISDFRNRTRQLLLIRYAICSSISNVVRQYTLTSMIKVKLEFLPLEVHYRRLFLETTLAYGFKPFLMRNRLFHAKLPINLFILHINSCLPANQQHISLVYILN
jgi:hypothetical protein